MNEATPTVTQPRTVTLSFEELHLTPADVLTAMGYEPDSAPLPVGESVDALLQNAGHYCRIQAGYSIFETVRRDAESTTFAINEKTFTTGPVVTAHLKNAEGCIVFVCTAGPEIEKWSRRITAEGDPVGGYVIDTIGSEIVERAMDKIQLSIEQEFADSGIRMTNRFSPGYCSWPVSEQHKLFSLLPENFCGISLSSSALMHPIKSISGIIGTGPHVVKREYGCALCSMENCIRRKRK